MSTQCTNSQKAICNTTIMIRHEMSQVAEKTWPPMARRPPNRTDVGPALAENNPPPGTCHINHKKSIEKHPCDFYITIYTSIVNPNWFNIKTTSSLYQNSRQMAWQPYDTGQESSYLMYWLIKCHGYEKLLVYQLNSEIIARKQNIRYSPALTEPCVHPHSNLSLWLPSYHSDTHIDLCHT